MSTLSVLNLQFMSLSLVCGPREECKAVDIHYTLCYVKDLGLPSSLPDNTEETCLPSLSRNLTNKMI